MTTLDPVVGRNKIASMVRRFIHNAMRSSMEEMLHKPFQEINGSLQRLESGLRDTNLKVDALGTRLDSRIDALDVKLTTRIDDGIRHTAALGARLDSRIDEMGVRLGIRIDEMGVRIDEMGTRLGTRIDDMGARVDEMGTRLGSRIDEMGVRVDEMGTHLGSRIDEMGARIDETGGRLDNFANRFSDKFDELSAQQGRIIEEIANLKGEVAGLKTDQKLVDTLEHRVARIEDRLFSKAV